MNPETWSFVTVFHLLYAFKVHRVIAYFCTSILLTLK